MRKYTVLLLFICAWLSGRSQYSSKISQLKEQLAQSKEDTGRVNLQLKLGIYYMYGDEIPNHFDSSKSFYNQAIQLSIKLHETDLQHKILEKVALYYSLTGDSASSRQTFDRVIAYYHQTGQPGKEAKMWQELAERHGHFYDSEYLNETIGYYERARSLYLKNNQLIEAAGVLGFIANHRVYFKQFDTAEKELQEVLSQYKAAGYNKLQPVYQHLYLLHRNKGNYYRALAYLLEAVRNMSVDGDSLQAGAYYHFAAECNMAVKKYEEAIVWISKASAIRKTDAQLKLLHAQSLIALNRLQEAWMILKDLTNGQPKKAYINPLILNWTLAGYYNKINKHDRSIRYFLNAIEINRRGDRLEPEDNTWYARCYSGIAEVYLKVHEPIQAKKYLDSAGMVFGNAKTSLDPALLADYYGHLYKYNIASGNYAAAVKNMELRVKIQDSLFTADKDKQLAELNIQYETVQKEQSIKNLQIQRDAQHSEMEKATLQRNITIAGILIMILVSFLFYRNYRQKKEANEIIGQKNGLLERLVTEKEWLLKEVHHRVKNNLQTIISLLQSQAIYLQDDALEANQISKNRIYAMSLIHQQLYKTEDMKSIDMGVFLPELLDHLRESFGTERKILFHHAISPIRLGISQAIPIALIVNESVTNAIKYAFPDERPGNINISMQQSGETITLVISDDGIGMDPAIIDKETNSLGMKLLKGLTEDIGGEVLISNQNGTKITIIFTPDPLNEFSSSSESGKNALISTSLPIQ